MMHRQGNNLLNKTKIFILSFFFLAPLIVIAQKTGKTEIILSDTRIGALVEKHKAWCESRGSIKGFRIQIFFDSGNNSKSKAISAMSEFRSKHSKIDAYLMFQEPNYKVRVGDFRTRMDAQGFLHKISDDYPNAFIVKDNEINFPPLDQEED